MNGREGLLAARFEIDFHVLAEHMETMQLLFWCNTAADKNEAYQELRLLLDQILARYFEKEEKGALHLNALYYETAYLLTSNFFVKTDDARVYLENTQDKQRIRQIQNYIQANYQSEISLKDLASRLFLSNAYLSRYVKKHLGLTFMKYLNNVRLFHALDELLYTQKNMTHIALDNGFPTSAAFTKAFRDVYGMAPSEYRKEMNKQGEVTDPRQNLSSEELTLAQRYLELRKEEQEPDASTVKTAVIDTKQKGSVLSEGYKSICVGEAYKILQSDVQSQMKELKEAADIQYARIWNLFSREECFNEKEGCNFTISNRNLLHDSCEQGAYVLKNCIDMNGEVDRMAYWHAFDNYSDYYDAEPLQLGFRLENVKNGNYLVKTLRVNRVSGSAQDIWRSLEYSKNLSKDEMSYLRKSAIPKMEMHHTQVDNECLEIENTLMEQEIRLLDIRYRYTAE